MRNFLRKIFLWVGSIFWSHRFRISSIVASSFALQAFSCAYGTDDPCHENCYDPALDCVPEINYDAMTGKDYSECEQDILDTIKARRLRNINEYGVCFKDPCSITYEEQCQIRENCPLDHIKADSALSGYRCQNSEFVSVEEGERAASAAGKKKRGRPRRLSPYERTKAQVHATGNRWAIENFEATH